MKRFMKFMLAFVLTVMCLVPSVGAIKNYDNKTKTGIITISNAVEGKTYDVYQILRLDSCTGNADNSACASDTDGYVYKIDTTSPWYAFVSRVEDTNTEELEGIKDVYLAIDTQGYVTWVGDKSAARLAAFSELALEYAKANVTSVASTKYSVKATKVGEGESATVSAVIDNLPLGYYVVDSSLGALCGLTTTKPATSVQEKNSEPTIDKTVKENLGGWDNSNTAFIGETVDFKIEVNVGKGAESYVIKDVLSDGLTLNREEGDITILYDGVAVDKEDYDLDTTEHSFTITFDTEYVRTFVNDKKIVVTYSAVLNENAVVGGEGNNNTATLEYGNNHKVESTTTTFTYGFDIVKTDDNKTLLVGAKFRLYDALTGGNQICLVKVTDTLYRVNHNACTVNPETGADTYVVIDGTENAKITIQGLDAKKYYVEEIQNPDGYTKLLEREMIEITDANNYAEVNDDKYVSGGLQVINTKGSLLPETGGMGTALFITLGSFMIVLFGILLVAKVRMSKENNN